MSTLYVDRRATEAKLDAGAIVFSAEGVRLATVPIAPVTRLIINGGLTLDSSLLGKLGEQNIGVIILTGYKHEPVLFFPRAHNDATRRLRQAMVVNNESASLVCSRRLVELKISGQKELLSAELSNCYPRPLDLKEPLEEMTNLLARLPQQSSCSALLGAEGAAAGAYFRGIACILPNSLGFQGRNLRPPKDPFNAVLSLCYTLLYAEAQLVIHAAGYDPYWGVLHKMAFGRASFACDVMEPIRPMVDRFAIDAFRNHILRAEDFSTSQNSCLLGKAGRSRLYPAWEIFMDKCRPSIRKTLAEMESLFDTLFPRQVGSA